ncbi:MAG: ATP-dependent DNA ligase, partial [Rhizobiales bacterium 17-65-6]
MNRFAALLDRLAYEAGRNAKIRLMADYFRATPDPERGIALAALTGALSFTNAKPAMVRALIMERADPVLFGLSYDYVGDLSETVALMWPAPPPHERPNHSPLLSEIVEGLATLPKRELPVQLARWLDGLDDTGRWALLKLITGSLRVGASARLAKTAVASLGDLPPDAVELVWPGLAPPYQDLFAWVEGRAGRPETGDPVPFRPVMLAHAVEEADFAALDPADFSAEWKWDGIRVQVVAGEQSGEEPDGARPVRLYSRTGEDISAAFPDVAEVMAFSGALDGELLVMKEGRVQSFNVLQQRLNRKAVTPKMLRDFPAHVRAYDLLAEAGEDLRDRPFLERRARLEALVTRLGQPRLDRTVRGPHQQTKPDSCDRSENKVNPRPRRRHRDHAPARIAQAAEIHRHRLGPAK